MTPIDVVVAKQAILEGLYRYCRSIDRMDRDLMATVFHPDATVEFPYLAGTWREFVEWVWTTHDKFDIHSHQVTNALIDVAADGVSAVSEAYVTASLWLSNAEDGEVEQQVAPGHDVIVGTRGGVEHHVRARYLDRWSLRDDVWAIDHRQCITDLQTITPTTGLVGAGRRDAEDPSYGLSAQTFKSATGAFAS